jgi:hypothetical protein
MTAQAPSAPCFAVRSGGHPAGISTESGQEPDGKMTIPRRTSSFRTPKLYDKPQQPTLVSILHVFRSPRPALNSIVVLSGNLVRDATRP